MCEKGDRDVFKKGEENKRLRNGVFILCRFSFTGNY